MPVMLRAASELMISVVVENPKPAVDKLLSIIKSEENLSVRRRAISQLSRSEDPRIKQALQDLVMK